MIHFKAALSMAAKPIAYALDPAFAAAGFAVGGTAAVASAEGSWVAPGYFFGALLVMQTLELLSCYFTTEKPKRRTFEWEQKAVGKLLIMFLVVVSLILDGMLYFGAQQFPADVLPMLKRGTLFVTMSSLTWFIIAEAARTVRNVAHSEGAAAIPPVVLWVIGRIRKEDVARYQGEGEPPMTRRIDRLTEDDIRRIIEEGKQDPADPPPPLKLEA